MGFLHYPLPIACSASWKCLVFNRLLTTALEHTAAIGIILKRSIKCRRNEKLLMMKEASVTQKAHRARKVATKVRTRCLLQTWMLEMGIRSIRFMLRSWANICADFNKSTIYIKCITSVVQQILSKEYEEMCKKNAEKLWFVYLKRYFRMMLWRGTGREVNNTVNFISLSLSYSSFHFPNRIHRRH